MFPVDSDIYDHGINQQPLIFINSYSYQWPENVASMMKLVTPPDETGTRALVYGMVLEVITTAQCIYFI